MPATVPAQSLREVPEEWLEVYITVISEEPADDPDAAFAEQMKAIFRMHEIEAGEGVFLHGLIRDPGAAQIELDRRRGVKPRAPELMSRSDAVASVMRCLDMPKRLAWWCLDTIPEIRDRERRLYKLADVQALLNSAAS